MQSLANCDLHAFCRATDFFIYLSISFFLFFLSKFYVFRKFVLDIQLNINQMNFRVDIERIKKRNESVTPSPRS